MKKIDAYLRLMRPANIVTAFADILAGFGIVAIPIIQNDPQQLPHLITLLLLLLIATAGVYGGGVVFNDICDAAIDQKERPERPIPKGIISTKAAMAFALGMWLIALITAFLVSVSSGILALAIILLSISYDAYAKHSLWLGPINMGLCRSGNLLLGISIIENALPTYWMLMAFPFIYISAITLISQGEVHGSSKPILLVGLILFVITMIGILMLEVLEEKFSLLRASPFLIIFIYLVFTSLLKAIWAPASKNIRKTVKIGVISLIILDASLASGYAGLWYGTLMLILLLPTSLILAKKFSVT